MRQDDLAKKLGIGKSQLSKFKARGCPVDDEGKARCWISANIKPRGKRKGDAPAPSTGLPPPETPVPEEEFSWEKRLERARKMEVAVYDASKLAIRHREFAQLQSLLASYQKALQGIAEAEKVALESRIQSGELIHRDTAKALLAELLVPIRNALETLPITERSRCNPVDPKTAEDALRGWKDSLLLRLSQAGSTL